MLSSVKLFDQDEFAQSLLDWARRERFISCVDVYWRLVVAHKQCAPGLFPGVLARVIITVCAGLDTASDAIAFRNFVGATTICIIGSPCLFGHLDTHNIALTPEMSRKIENACQKLACEHQECIEARFISISHVQRNAKHACERGVRARPCLLSDWVRGKICYTSNLKLSSVDKATLDRLLRIPLRCTHATNAEETSLIALNASEEALRTMLMSRSSLSSSSSLEEPLDRFVVQVILAHTTTAGLYHAPRISTSTSEAKDNINAVAMQAYLVNIKSAWCALLNIIGIDSPRRWVDFHAQLVDACRSSCPGCENTRPPVLDADNVFWMERTRKCRFLALRFFRRLQHTETNVAHRAVQIVDAITTSTPLPCVLARLSAIYEVDSSLHYTIRTIEAGHSVSRMFS